MRPEWRDGSSTREVVAGFIKPNDRLTSFARLEIYNRQYWFRLIECFYEDYPGLRTVLGDHQFHNLAIAYLANFPSSSFTLRNLGRQLVSFITAEPRWTAPQQEAALAMAHLEWAHIEAFDNEAKTPVTVDQLRGRNPADIHLHLQPHITLLRSNWPMDDFLISLRRETGLRGEASNAVDQPVEHRHGHRRRLPKRRSILLAVHRYRNVVYYKRLQRSQFNLLTSLNDGASLERALQSVTAPKAAASVHKWFANWAALGWFWIGR